MKQISVHSPTRADIAIDEKNKDIIISFGTNDEMENYALHPDSALEVSLGILQKIVSLYREETITAQPLPENELVDLPRLMPVQLSATAIEDRILLAARIAPHCVIPIELTMNTAEQLLRALSAIIENAKGNKGAKH